MSPRAPRGRRSSTIPTASPWGPDEPRNVVVTAVLNTSRTITTAEQAAWCRLADPRSGIRQIEQERVPAAIAERMLKAALGL